MTLSSLILALSQAERKNALYPEILVSLESLGDSASDALDLYNGLSMESGYHRRATLRAQFESRVAELLKGTELLARFDRISQMDLNDLVATNSNPSNASSVKSSSIPRGQSQKRISAAA